MVLWMMLMLCTWICYSMKEVSLYLSLSCLLHLLFPILTKCAGPSHVQLLASGWESPCWDWSKHWDRLQEELRLWFLPQRFWCVNGRPLHKEGSCIATPFQWEAIMAVIFTIGRMAFRLSDWHHVLQKDMLRKAKEVGIVCVYVIRAGEN